MVYYMSVTRVNGREQPSISYQSMKYAMCLQQLIITITKDYVPFMLDHEKALKQLELYGGMEPYMRKALETINFHSSCCTNNNACDVHTHSSSSNNQTRLCDKIILRLVHDIHNDLIVYHRISYRDVN